MSHGIDLSNNNEGELIDWTDAKFMVGKATEATGYVDGTLQNWIAGARSIDAQWSTYHFAHPDKNSAKDEAEFYLKNAPKGDFGPCLDFETRDWNGEHFDPVGILGVRGACDWANEWMDRVAQVRQQQPFFYSFRDYVRLMVAESLTEDCLLWLSTMVGHPMFPSFAGRTVAIEQWGVVGGVDQNESYQPLVEEEDMGKPITMVMPDSYKDKDGNVIAEHPHAGQVWKSDGILANHVGSTDLVTLYQYLGIPGPTVIQAEWFDDLTLLPNHTVPTISQ